MKVATTVNIDPEVKLLLDRAAEVTGMSRSEVVVRVMRRAIRDFRRFVRYDRAVRYQEKNPPVARKKIHLSLIRRDYEYFLDSRKLFKCSVSWLVVFSVYEYLDEVIKTVLDEKYNEDADNYPFLNYLIMPEMVENVVCWKIYWGLPRKLNPQPLSAG